MQNFNKPAALVASGIQKLNPDTWLNLIHPDDKAGYLRRYANARRAAPFCGVTHYKYF